MRLVLAILFAFMLFPTRVDPSEERLEMDVLVVLYTSTFTRTLTPAEIAIFHNEMAKFKYWYDKNVGNWLKVDLSYVQIDRTLSPDEIGVNPDGGTYFGPNETLNKDLKLKGIEENKFSNVILFYAWRNFVPPWNAYQLYGGGAMGPDTSIALVGAPGNTGFFSVSALTWGPDMSGFPVHEFTHNLDAMFYMCDMDTEMLHGDHMAINMPRMLKEMPGAFLPDFTDEEMLENAKLEMQGKYGFPWKHQEIYYRWILNRPGKCWLKLAPRYGRIVPRKPLSGIVPLYKEIITAKGNSAYLSVFVYDEEGNPIDDAIVTAKVGKKKFNFRCEKLKRLEDPRKGKDNVLWAFPLYSCWVPVNFNKPKAVHITAKKDNVRMSSTVIIHPTNLGMIDAPPLIIVQKDMRDKPTISCRVITESLDRSAKPIPATITASIDTLRIELNNTDGTGTCWGSFDELPLGMYDVVISATFPKYTILEQHITLWCKYRWDVKTDKRYAGMEGEPIKVKAQILRENGSPVKKVEVLASINNKTIKMKDTDEDGTFEGQFEPLPPGKYEIEIKATLTDRPNSITRSIPLEVKPKGTIEGEDNIPPFASSGDRASIQDIGSWGKEWQGIWSGDKQLFYTCDSIGDYVTFKLEIAKSSNYEIIGYFTKANDYGIFQLSIDDKKLGIPFDGYNPEVIRSDEIKFGKIFLKKGIHRLKLTIIDKNPKSRGYFIGVDCFIIREITQ
ncbi:MAG TPA: hypothetical protein EYP60_04120 [bacterium (Candidatus Stahlbacteria)]|nr:hypothetical protein [Candidatus Stahlbacteria bacterium]